MDGAKITGNLLADPDGEVMTDAELTGCRCDGGTLTGQRFLRLQCADVVFENCDLSGVITEDSALRRVEFRECRMSGIVFAGATLHDVRFTRCKLDMANLRMVEGKRMEFLGSDLRDADFYAATLTGSRIHDCDLSAAEFSQAQAGRIRLHGSRLRGITGISALRGAVISQDQVVDVSTALFDASGITVDDER